MWASLSEIGTAVLPSATLPSVLPRRPFLACVQGKLHLPRRPCRRAPAVDRSPDQPCCTGLSAPAGGRWRSCSRWRCSRIAAGGLDDPPADHDRAVPVTRGCRQRAQQVPTLGPADGDLAARVVDVEQPSGHDRARPRDALLPDQGEPGTTSADQLVGGRAGAVGDEHVVASAAAPYRRRREHLVAAGAGHLAQLAAATRTRRAGGSVEPVETEQVQPFPPCRPVRPGGSRERRA